MECHGYGHLHRFQSTLPNGSDVYYGELEVGGWNFNPRSQTGATNLSCGLRNGTTFQSTLPNGSDLFNGGFRLSTWISIHAPKRERQAGNPHKQGVSGISIHAPKRERHISLTASDRIPDFNPRSQTGATGALHRWKTGVLHFNPRSQTGATGSSIQYSTEIQISIHAPKRERRRSVLRSGGRSQFQSTLPNGSDNFCSSSPYNFSISIHAPKRERRILCLFIVGLKNFNPRSQTGATLTASLTQWFTIISIHAPKRERLQRRTVPGVDWNFNPRSQTGATPDRSLYNACLLFQSTLPNGSDHRSMYSCRAWFISIHAPKRERRQTCTISHSKIMQSLQ